MSPILDLQQRITERGRIRLGMKVDGTRRDGSTYTRPAKSRTFLVSSHDRTVVETARQEWADTAGEVETFDAGFRVDTGRTELDVILPPEMMSFSQWREMWGNGYCARRCDGQRETISDGPCLCPPDHEERRVLASKGKACKDTTRLSVMLPDLPGFGLWRVESHGFYAATELAGAVQAVTHLAPNTLVRARLTAVAREVVRFDAEGNPKTHKFVVPTLDLPDVRLRELMAPDGGVGVQIQAPARAGLTPVPVAELPEGPRPSIAEQVAAVPDRPKPRKNAAAPLPATGLKPRKSAPDREVPAASATVEPAVIVGEVVGSAPPGGPPPPGGKNVTGGDDGRLPETEEPARAPSGDAPTLKEQDNKKYQTLNRFCRAVAGGWDEDVRAPRWEALAYQVSGARTTHLGELTPDEAQDFRARIEDGAKGRAHWVESDDPAHLGWTLAVGGGTAA